MHRSASRLTRILACAAVPVMLVVAGCSSDSGDKSDADGSSTSPAAAPSPTVVPAKFSGLPDACKTISGKSIESLVPKAKAKGGAAGTSSDTATRGSCSWNGLDDNGVKGSQYRWLDVSLMRYDSDATLGSGAKRADEYYTKEIAGARGTEGAKDVKSAPTTGIGDQATTVTYSLKKSSADFAYATIVTRTENVVITLTYNGAGLAGAKSPSIADLTKDAVKTSKEAVAAIAAGSGGSGSGGSGSKESPAKESGSSEGVGASPESSSADGSKTE
ncbi:DUF3558 domain-containing protein [Streptomyces corynorhini]|uniref:DUF3558 domain-containing protein n=1 Tax=Streptomyces corynorhini TaxID=2282652 RepID=A0A370B666_9ACTN|nr:DUF3558 domain-containing protein [Streptomyces corynorhini]RDG35574.1 DUF3558 domain-containing protein [Streptomyces corynorhini]